MIRFRPYTDFVVVVGNKAYGKTKYTIWFSKHLNRLIAIDDTFQMGSLGFCVHYPERIVEAFQKWKRVVYQPIIRGDQKDMDVYDQVFNKCRKLRNYTIIVDEIDEFAPTWGFKSGNFREIIKRGRVQGIGVIGNTRRPSDMNKAFRTQADYVVCFGMTDEDDLKYMASWMNINSEKIENLPEYHFFVRDVRRKTTRLNKPCPLVS